MFHRATPLESPGNFLKIQIFCPHFRLTKSKIIREEVAVCPSIALKVTPKFENYWTMLIREKQKVVDTDAVNLMYFCCK